MTITASGADTRVFLGATMELLGIYLVVKGFKPTSPILVRSSR